MDRIDIKDFKSISRFTVIEGIFKKAEKSLEGKELEFYNLDKDTLDKIMQEKDIDKGDNIDFLFRVIPIFSNVDMTINRDEFAKMYKIPSLQFANYIDLLMEHIVEMYKTGQALVSLESKVQDFAKENNIIIPEPKIEIVKTKEEIIEELYKEIENSIGDRVKIKELMNKINELEKEVESIE